MLTAVPDKTKLADDGLLLRPWTGADVERVAAIVADPDIAHWSGVGKPTPAQWCDRISDWSDGTHATWAVTLRGEVEQIAGYVSLHHLDPDNESADIGYWTVATHRRRGVAVRALRIATTYAFQTLTLRRVQLFHAVDNVASCLVAQRAGYRLEGVHRESYRYGDGHWHDEHSHARLRSDKV